MIRDYLPIVLIPAAWILSLATIVYPGLDTYWLQHMHLFITGFLALFALASWREMDDQVLKAWRNIIAAGVFFYRCRCSRILNTGIQHSSLRSFSSLLVPFTGLRFQGDLKASR